MPDLILTDKILQCFGKSLGFRVTEREWDGGDSSLSLFSPSLSLFSSLPLFYLDPAGEKSSSPLKQQDLWPQSVSCTPIYMPITTPDNRHGLKLHTQSHIRTRHCNSVTFPNSFQRFAPTLFHTQTENNAGGQRHAN